MGFCEEGKQMTSKISIFLAVGIAVFGMYGEMRGQVEDKEDVEDAAAATPASPPVIFKYSGSQDPLQMLQEIAAANDEILRKQGVCLGALTQLEEKAKAARASAHRSTSKKK
jgi:hypothetical protein